MDDGVAKDVAYILDGLGQIIRRDEVRSSSPGQAAPHELFYRFAGKQMGILGNNGTLDTGYVESVKERSTGRPDITSASAGLFRNGTNSGSASYADFSQSLEAYNSNAQGSGAGSYSVRTGDTLQSIAASLWGDGNLWYRLAEANGLSAGTALSEGQSLTLPAGVTKSTHNAGTFRPYDASEALGDTLPTTPKPPKTPKCGTLGIIIMIAIAVAVAAIAGPALIGTAAATVGSTTATVVTASGTVIASTATATVATGLTASLGAVGGAIAGGALAAAAGSIASQAFGVASGAQNKFSFKQVALAALSGGIGGGLGSVIKGAGILAGAARGALGSAATQGIATATGLQDRFSWTGVAAAGVGAGVAAGAANSFGNQAVVTMADTIAQAATRSAIKGNSFGDNLLASLPSALGNLAGRALAGGIATAFDGRSGGGGDALAVVQTKGNAVAAYAVDEDSSAELASGGVGGPGEEGDGIVRSIATPGYPSSPLVAGEGGPRSIRRLYEYLHQDDSILEDGSETYLLRRAELAEYLAINHLIAPTIGTGLSLNESLASYAANSTGFSFQEYDHENMLDPNFERTLFEDYVQPFFKEMSQDKNYGEYFGEISTMTSSLYSEYQQTGGYKHWQQQTAKWDAQSTTIVAIAAAPVALMEVAPLYAGLTKGGPALRAVSGLGAVVAANQVSSDLTAGLREDRQTFLAKGIDKYFPGYGDITVAGLSLATGVGAMAAYKFGFRATLPDKPIFVHGKWKLPPGFQKPAEKMGGFTGDIGDSPFKLSKFGAKKHGLPEGTEIPWRRGVPDFLDHVVAGPNGMKGQFVVNGMTGEHGADKAAMISYMAQETGMTQKAVKRWLLNNPVELHHAGGHVAQIVPYKIHKLHHSGGAQQMRR